MNDANISQCKFNAEMVPYMYGELSASESSAFESHLLDCRGCTDEFAAISNARYEVYDWKKIEFDALATPHIQIPYEAQSDVSWIEKVRAVFAQSWAVPGVAVAGLAVVSIFAAVFVLSRSAGPDVAREVDNSNRPPVVLPTSPDPKAVATQAKDDEASSRKPEDQAARILDRKRPEQRTAVRGVRQSEPKTVEARQATTREQKKVPRLNEFADDEDTSLRLAELFEDVETRE